MQRTFKWWGKILLGVSVMTCYGEDLTFGRYGEMVHEYYVQKFQAAAQQRQQQLAKLQTKKDAELYVQSVRTRLQKSFGAFPQRTPLNARMVGQVTVGKFLIDKVIFESRPQLEVTANFYRRSDIHGKMPGVLLVLGHDNPGKYSYQDVAQRLAICGYGVLVIDPIGQGERRQFAPGTPGITGCCSEHNMLGKKMQLLGENLSLWRVWDAIRGLDYLLSRPDIDARRVGVTGCSGGGTLTSFVNAFDPRFTMAAPCCYITTLLRNLENELPADSEQNPPNFVALGLDEADLLIAAAPRPTVILAQNNDFFDPRGAQEVFRDVQKVYTLLGYPDNIKLIIGPGNHGYPVHHQLNCRDFFNSVTGLKTVEVEVQKLPQEKINCYAPGQRPALMVQDLLTAQAQKLAKTRPALTRDQMAQKAQQLLNIPEVTVPDYRMYRASVHDLNQQHLELETYFDRFGLKTEPGIRVTLKRLNKGKLLFHAQFQPQVVLFVPHLSTSPELRRLGYKFDPKQELLSCEVRGIGETRPAEISSVNHDFFQDYGQDLLCSSSALMLNELYLGRKVYDLLSAIKFLQHSGVRNIELVGNGQGAIIAALAAALTPEIKVVKLHNAPESFRSMVTKTVTRWPHSIMPLGVLKHFDLPELYRTIGAQVISYTAEPFQN